MLMRAAAFPLRASMASVTMRSALRRPAAAITTSSFVSADLRLNRLVSSSANTAAGAASEGDGAAAGIAVTAEAHGSGVRMVLPLPGAGNTMFTLAPSHTVAHLTQAITQESSLSFLSSSSEEQGTEQLSSSPSTGVVRIMSASEGVSYAAATPLSELLSAPSFDLLIGAKNVFHVTVPANLAVASADVDTNALSARLADTLAALEAERAERVELRNRATRLAEELAPMEALRTECQNKASASARRQAWLALSAMGLQFGFMARLTWWDFSWDIMEPVTYFITFATQMGFCAYFVLTQRDYEYETLHGRKELRAFYGHARRAGLDVGRYNELKRQKEEVATALQQR